jgi:hypothetical protein
MIKTDGFGVSFFLKTTHRNCTQALLGDFNIRFSISPACDIQSGQLRQNCMDVAGYSMVSSTVDQPKKKSYWCAALILVLFFGGYWLKCRLGINFFDSISISSYFPFSYLIDDVLVVKEPGTVFYEDFDHARIFSQWSDSTFYHNYRAVRHVIEGGVSDHSRCLQIASDKKGCWAYPFSKFIRVTKGDVFRFEGLVNLERNSTPASLCVAALDENKKTIDWYLAVQSCEKSGAWVKVRKQFSITDDRIRYITFRLTGCHGVYCFDNLLLSKLK